MPEYSGPHFGEAPFILSKLSALLSPPPGKQRFPACKKYIFLWKIFLIHFDRKTFKITVRYTSRMRLLLATTNQGKIKELGKILGDEGFELVGLGGWAAEVEETGQTFVENALLKARYFHEISGLPTIADDSGLEVEALNSQPGVYSARY